MSEDIGLKAWVRVSTDKLQNLALSDPHRCPAQGFKTNMEPDDLFELPLPFALKSKIISERPIGIALRGHESDGEVDITVWP